MTLLSVVYYGTNSQYFAVFLLCQLICIVAYNCFKKRRNSKLPWLLLIVVCLTYIWDTDYYSYMYDYEMGLSITGEKEPLYLFLHDITQPYYLLWRLIIWGSATLLYYRASKRLGIEPYIAIYVLVIFFLPLFAYGRVNLAMAIYYYGFSFLIKPIYPNSKIRSMLLGGAILSCSFFAHRSFLPVIAMTPLFFMPFNKKTFVLTIIFIPVITLLINRLMSGFMTGSIQLDSTFENFQNSATRASNIEYEERGWKSLAMNAARNYSICIPCLYVVFRMFFSKSKLYIEDSLQPLVMCISLIVIISFCLLYGGEGFATETMAKRYLFMTGIGECLLLSYLYCKSYISEKQLNILILLGFLCTEANFILLYLSRGFYIVQN